MIIAVTGHRPEKLGGYGEDVTSRLVDLAEKSIRRLEPEKVITGLALGWDTAVASACIRLSVPFIAAIPFDGQERRWPERSKDRYRLILSRAADTKIVCNGGYASWKMHARNTWMVDNAEKLLALYDGSTDGGTYRCVEYARRKEVEIINVWEEWK